MDGLLGWLRQQLDEDERVAREAGDGAGNDWRTGTGMDEARIESAGMTIYDEGGHGVEQAVHIVRWDPARVLAEVEAKRRILELHVASAARPIAPGSASALAERNRAREALETIVRLLAQPYAGRDGWHKEWSA